MLSRYENYPPSKKVSNNDMAPLPNGTFFRATSHFSHVLNNIFGTRHESLNYIIDKVLLKLT